MNYSWLGWEWEGNLHVTQSRRHIRKEGEKTTVCGKHVPSHASSGQGEGVCKKCLNWEDNNRA